MKLRILCWIAFTTAVHLLFYRTGLGFNAPIFTLLSLLTVWAINGFKQKNKWLYLLVFATSLTSIYNATITGFLLTIIGIISLVGLETENLSQAFWGFCSGFVKMTRIAARRIPKEVSTEADENEKAKSSKKHLSYIITPILVCLLFLLLYMNSIPLLADLVASIKFNFADLLANIKPDAVLLFIFIFALSGFVFIKLASPSVVNKAQSTPLFINKKKHKVSVLGSIFEGFKLIPEIGNLALKHEFNIGKYLLISLNALILIVLGVGVYALLNPEVNANKLPYEVVHENTYTLIASLLLGALIVIYFFRGNINFYKQADSLKVLSKAWLGQNAILAFFNVINNYQYVFGFGLTYKRLGVFFFLTLTLIGLIIVFLKIDQRRSTFSVLKMGIYTVFLFTAIVAPINWDGIIVSYNLSNPSGEVKDLHYSLDLSPNSIPALIKQKHLYKHAIGLGTYANVLEHKTHAFKIQKKKPLGISILDFQIEKSISTFNRSK